MRVPTIQWRGAGPQLTGTGAGRVRPLAQSDDAFVLEAPGRTIVADQVVVATGPFQAPNIPSLGGQLAQDVVQMHSTGYRNPSDLPEGRVLVVGGGNTGFQIAK